MRLVIIASLSTALLASTVFCWLMTCGKTPVTSGDMCQTIKMVASKSLGSKATNCLMASKPPAEAPITMIFLFSKIRLYGRPMNVATEYGFARADSGLAGAKGIG